MTLKELRQLAERATPGPWDIALTHNGFVAIERQKARLTGQIAYQTDAEYISAANPETIKQLIAKVEGLSEAIEQTVARADDYGDSHLSQPVREALAQFGPEVELK